MEILCAIHNCGENVEKLWSICGYLTHWKITDWKIPKTRYNGVVREPTEGMEKCFGKLQTGQALKAAGRFWLELSVVPLE